MFGWAIRWLIDFPLKTRGAKTMQIFKEIDIKAIAFIVVIKI